MALLATFFSCRLIWGTYQSFRVYQDVWHAVHLNTTGPVIRPVHTRLDASIFVPRDGQLCLGKESCVLAQAEVMKFTGDHTTPVPIWLATIYLTCNLVLNGLNFHWFAKMIKTVRKRFQGRPHDEFAREREVIQNLVEEMATELEHETLSGPKTPAEEKEEPFTHDAGKATALFDNGTVVNRRRKDLS